MSETSLHRLALGRKLKRRLEEIRDSWVPELAELKRLRAEKQMGRISIEEAVDVYIADVRTRNQRATTVANARSLFRSEKNPLSLVAWTQKYNSGKQEDGRLAWLDQLDGTLLSRWPSEWIVAPLTLEEPLESGCFIFQLVLSYRKTSEAPLHGSGKLQRPGGHDHALYGSAI